MAMFKFIEDLPEDVMAIEATGKVTHEDYKSTAYAKRTRHPEFKDRTIWEVFQDERARNT